MKYSIAFIAVAGALCLAPAQARDGHDVARSQIVSYADLDLNSEHGRAALNRRLHTAVREVCGTASTSDLAASTRIWTCRKTLMRQAAEISGELTMAARRETGMGIASAR